MKFFRNCFFRTVIEYRARQREIIGSAVDIGIVSREVSSQLIDDSLWLLRTRCRVEKYEIRMGPEYGEILAIHMPPSVVIEDGESRQNLNITEVLT